MHLRPPLRGGAGPRAAPPIQVRANKAANRQPVSAPQMADLGGFGAPARWHAPPNSVLSAQFSLYGPRMHSHRGPMRSTAWYGVPHVQVLPLIVPRVLQKLPLLAKIFRPTARDSNPNRVPRSAAGAKTGDLGRFGAILHQSGVKNASHEVVLRGTIRSSTCNIAPCHCQGP